VANLKDTIIEGDLTKKNGNSTAFNYTYAASSLDSNEIPMYNGSGELVGSLISYVNIENEIGAPPDTIKIDEDTFVNGSLGVYGNLIVSDGGLIKYDENTSAIYNYTYAAAGLSNTQIPVYSGSGILSSSPITVTTVNNTN